jgi:hypothetical protein
MNVSWSCSSSALTRTSVSPCLQRRQPLQPSPRPGPGPGAAREADHHLHAPVRRHIRHAQGQIHALVIRAQAMNLDLNAVLYHILVSRWSQVISTWPSNTQLAPPTHSWHPQHTAGMSSVQLAAPRLVRAHEGHVGSEACSEADHRRGVAAQIEFESEV